MRPMAEELSVHGITREIRSPSAILRGMAKHPELCFILLTIVVTFLSNYGTSIKNKPLVVPARVPQPLFPRVSPVLDLYLGDLQPLVNMLQQEDIIFTMYYAPWCAKSHRAMSQFLLAAKFLDGQVKFVAVNCWYPEGLCRKQYKFLLYPVFFAYHGNNNGYRYLGIERAEFMVKFLEDLLHPLSLLNTVNELKDFVIQHDTVVVGYFEFNSSPQPPGFQQFFFAAMRIVERDPYQPVKFGVITDYFLATQCHLAQPSDIAFFRINNSTLKFPMPDNITATNIVTWVLSSRGQLPVPWLVPLGLKSLMLSKEINKGPAIIMFHRVSPLSTASQTFIAFKDLALHYNQCPGDDLAEDSARRWLALSVRNVIQHARILNSCKDPSKGQPFDANSFKCCISTTSECRNCFSEAKLNVCEICQHRPGIQRFSSSVCLFSGRNRAVCDPASASVLPPNSCQNSIANYDVSSHTSVCCKCCNRSISYTEFLHAPFTSHNVSGQHTSQGRRLSDRYVIESLENLPHKLCSKLTFQKNQKVFPSAIIPDFASSSLPAEFTGRGCGINRTLSFITLDSQNHWMFAESLGLNVTLAHVSPIVVAVDKEKEELLVLKEKFSKKMTASFIFNFTKGMLRRELRSLSSSAQENCTSNASLCVRELTSDTFLPAIWQPQDMVLLVYANWCGFCATVSHVFLHLAHYFHTSPNITFARINGDTNDLPWEFTMDSYPTIIFFPAYRENDSVAFPDNLSPSLPNLIRFVLQHASSSTRLHLVADVCSASCVQENLDICRFTLRVLRTKLRHLQIRMSAGYFQLTMEKILKEKIADIQTEMKAVKNFTTFLESSKGKSLDFRTLERLYYERLQRKDLNVRTS